MSCQLCHSRRGPVCISGLNIRPLRSCRWIYWTRALSSQGMCFICLLIIVWPLFCLVFLKLQNIIKMLHFSKFFRREPKAPSVIIFKRTTFISANNTLPAAPGKCVHILLGFFHPLVTCSLLIFDGTLCKTGAFIN